MEINSGDTIEVVTNKVGQVPRRGVVERIIEEDPLRIEVAWDDGHISEFVPTGGNVRVRSRAG